MAYLIVSAATAGSRYVQCLEQHRQQLGDRFRGIVVPDRGSWAANTKIKPDVIRQALEWSDVVLWVDADCTVDPPDELPAGKWDICTTENIHPTHRLKISAGFLLFRKSFATYRFLKVWESLNRQHKKDHPAMVRAIRLTSSYVKFGDMTDWLKGRHVINELAPERGVVISAR